MAKPESCTGGFLGVNMFLVLSGYLTYKTSVWDQKIQMQYLLKLKWKEILAYSAEARQDLRDIYEYIAYELLVPETAAGQWLHCSER